MEKMFIFVRILKQSLWFTSTIFLIFFILATFGVLPPLVEAVVGLFLVANFFFYLLYKNKLTVEIQKYVNGVYDIDLNFNEAKILSTSKMFCFPGRNSFVSKTLTLWSIDVKGHTFPYKVRLEQTLAGKTILFNLSEKVEMLTSLQRVSDSFLTSIGQKFHFYALAKTVNVKGIEDFVDFGDPRDGVPVIPIWVHPAEIELYKMTNGYDYEIIVFEFMDFKRKLIPDACAESAKLTIYSGSKFNNVEPGVLLQYL